MAVGFAVMGFTGYFVKLIDIIVLQNIVIVMYIIFITIGGDVCSCT